MNLFSSCFAVNQSPPKNDDMLTDSPTAEQHLRALDELKVKILASDGTEKSAVVPGGETESARRIQVPKLDLALVIEKMDSDNKHAPKQQYSGGTAENRKKQSRQRNFSQSNIAATPTAIVSGDLLQDLDEKAKTTTCKKKLQSEVRDFLGPGFDKTRRKLFDRSSADPDKESHDVPRANSLPQ